MSGSNTFTQSYGFLQQGASDEAYFAAGTHRLPQNANDIPSTRQVAEDIDAGLQQFPSDIDLGLGHSANTTQPADDALDLSNLDLLSIDFDQEWMTGFDGPSSMPPAQSSFQSQDNFVASPPKRIDSGLRATAKEFIPSSQQWQNLQAMQWQQNTTQHAPPMLQPHNQKRMSLMTPIQTRFEAPYQTPPMTAPSRPDVYAMQERALATSPMISLTNESCVTSFPHADTQGYQWAFSTPPAQDISTWAHGTRDFVDPARLTPVTPVTPTYGGAALERTGSRTSRTSRTTAGPYTCDHDGCGKEFRSKTEFSHHKRNHGERHHVCGICHKKFVFRKDLGRHQKVHTDERQMFGDVVAGCQWCMKGFQRKDHYERHMKTHSHKGDALTPVDSLSAMSRSHSRQ